MDSTEPIEHPYAHTDRCVRYPLSFCLRCRSHLLGGVHRTFFGEHPTYWIPPPRIQSAMPDPDDWRRVRRRGRKRLTQGRMHKVFRVLDIKGSGLGPVVEGVEIHTFVLICEMRLGENLLGIPIVRRHGDFGPAHEFLADGVQAMICGEVRAGWCEHVMGQKRERTDMLLGRHVV
jgi:hypothetical protein